MGRRRQKIARLTEASHARLDRYCTEHRISFTALIEAIGERPDLLPSTIEQRAAEIDRERHTHQ